MSDIEQNKAVVAQFWEHFSNSDFDSALALLSEDATWWIAGTTDISGTYSKQEFAELAKGIGENTVEGIDVKAIRVTAEDDRVAVEAVSYGKMKNGKVYNNSYHLQHVVRDGKLIEIKEYLDTQHVQDIFGSD
ncbi:MAG: nuclear transport factor 2 family protein [Gammaproteobacteria bacterium]|nr:nuclear transport factor 2 family protein [Gammaproteobacteria bacterium]